MVFAPRLKQSRFGLFIMDANQVLNALGIFSMWKLPWLATNGTQRLTIVGMISCSFAYHLLLGVNAIAWARVLFVFDCMFQILSIASIAASSDCYPLHFQFMGTLLCGALCHRIVITATPLERVLDHDAKPYLLVTTIIAHIWNACISYMYAVDRRAYLDAMQALGCIIACFTMDEYGIPYTWPLGHLFCGSYVLKSWEAVGVALKFAPRV